MSQYLNCFYDILEMRQNFPQNYPQEFLLKSLIVPGRIICTPEVALFNATLVILDKNLSFADRNKEIRKQVEASNVILMTPSRPYKSMDDLMKNK